MACGWGDRAIMEAENAALRAKLDLPPKTPQLARSAARMSAICPASRKARPRSLRTPTCSSSGFRCLTGRIAERDLGTPASTRFPAQRGRADTTGSFHLCAIEPDRDRLDQDHRR